MASLLIALRKQRAHSGSHSHPHLSLLVTAAAHTQPCWCDCPRTAVKTDQEEGEKAVESLTIQSYSTPQPVGPQQQHSQ